MSQSRPLEDREISILMVEPGSILTSGSTVKANGAPLVVRYHIDGEGNVSATRPHQDGWSLDATAFLLDLPSEAEAILVVGPKARRLERGEGGSELINRAAIGAAGWRREHARAQRRLQLPDRLLAFTEELNRAHTFSSVCTALMEHVGRIVGAYTALVYLYEEDGSEPEGLRPAMHPWIPNGLTGSHLAPELRFEGPTVVTAEEVLPETGGPYLGLAPVFQAIGASSMASVPLGDHGLLIVAERRLDRQFEAEDWDLLRSLARLAEVAIERVQLFERVHELSLTDPLTGLGNRRKMEIVLEYSFAAARRGQPLSLVMLDLVGYKDLTGMHGQVRGDDVLKTFASVLRAEVRGSDLVVRYGGDEFLLVLNGSDEAAAEGTVERIRRGLPGTIQFTAGIAEYSPSIHSPAELVTWADRALVAARR
jgi:diguanylate cyclase (GGDEF)-like protein